MAIITITSPFLAARLYGFLEAGALKLSQLPVIHRLIDLVGYVRMLGMRPRGFWGDTVLVVCVGAQ